MLSLCMIAKNEEPFIKGCLESVRGLVDEMVVIDTGSTDKTKEIATSAGAAVFDFQWTNDFSAARNFAIGHTNGDWILFLDADEELNPKEYTFLRECIKATHVWGYRVPIFNYSHDSAALGWSSVTETAPAKGFPGFILTRVIRLFRKDEQIRYRFSVHEGVEFSIQEAGGVIAVAPFAIHHYGALRGSSASGFKSDTYFSLVKKDCAQYPLHPKPFYELGVGYLDLGDLPRAKEAFIRAAENNERYLVPYHHLAEIATREGNLVAARQLYEKSQSFCPDSEITYFRLGQVALMLKDEEAAIASWKEALKKNPRSIRYYDALIQLHLARKELLQALALLYDACANTHHGHFISQKEGIENELIIHAKARLAHGPERSSLVVLATIALYHHEHKKVIALCQEAKKYFSGAEMRVFDALIEKAYYPNG